MKKTVIEKVFFILYLIIKNKLTPNLKERGWNGYL